MVAESQSKHSGPHRHRGVCPTPIQAPSSVTTAFSSFSQFCWWVCLEGSALAGFSNPDFQGAQLTPDALAEGGSTLGHASWAGRHRKEHWARRPELPSLCPGRVGLLASVSSSVKWAWQALSCCLNTGQFGERVRSCRERKSESANVSVDFADLTGNYKMILAVPSPASEGDSGEFSPSRTSLETLS